MRIKLKRWLCYKGHQLFQTVTWSKLIQAVHKLKQIHLQYTNIIIRDDLLLCDPTLPDSSDERSMETDDWNWRVGKRCPFVWNWVWKWTSCDEQNPEEQNPEEPESDLNNGGFALESCLQPVDISEEILCCVAPAERNNTV